MGWEVGGGGCELTIMYIPADLHLQSFAPAPFTGVTPPGSGALLPLALVFCRCLLSRRITVS
jgi:hypothetical protein